MLVMRELTNVKQRRAISETSAEGGGLVETGFSSLGRMVALPGKRPCLERLWLDYCIQAPERKSGRVWPVNRPNHSSILAACG